MLNYTFMEDENDLYHCDSVEDQKQNWTPARLRYTANTAASTAGASTRRLPPSLLMDDDDLRRLYHHPMSDGQEEKQQGQQQQQGRWRGYYESYDGIMDELDRVLQTYHHRQGGGQHQQQQHQQQLQQQLHQLQQEQEHLRQRLETRRPMLSSYALTDPRPIQPGGIDAIADGAIPLDSLYRALCSDLRVQDDTADERGGSMTLSQVLSFLKNLNAGATTTTSTVNTRYYSATDVLPNASNAGLPYHHHQSRKRQRMLDHLDQQQRHGSQNQPSPVRSGGSSSSGGSSGSDPESSKIRLHAPGFVRRKRPQPGSSVEEMAAAGGGRSSIGVEHHHYDSDKDTKLPARSSAADDDGGDGTATRRSSKRTSREVPSSSPTSSLMYKPEKWDEKYQQLVDFKSTHGHCLVPHNWIHNPSLAQWVKRQRYQYVLKHKTWGRCSESKRVSTLTDKRQELLESIGFVWSPHDAMWEEKYHELMDYKQVHGHCNVPTNYPQNRSLSSWVRGQRHQYKLLLKSTTEEGEQHGAAPASEKDAAKNKTHNAMMMERMERLKSLGFNFNPRNLKRRIEK